MTPETASCGADIKNVLKITAIWDVALCSLVEVDHRFRGACCLHHQGDENLKSRIKNVLSWVSRYSFVFGSGII
jgi:hypothetical protein